MIKTALAFLFDFRAGFSLGFDRVLFRAGWMGGWMDGMGWLGSGLGWD